MERRRHSDPERHSSPQAQESTSPAHLFLPTQLWQTFPHTHTRTYTLTHACNAQKKKIYTGVFFSPSFSHTHGRTSESAPAAPSTPPLAFFFFTLLICSFGFSYSAPPASSIFSPRPPPLPRPPSQHLAKLASRFDYTKTTSPPPPNPPSLLPAASTPILCHRGGSES